MNFSCHSVSVQRVPYQLPPPSSLVTIWLNDSILKIKVHKHGGILVFSFLMLWPTLTVIASNAKSTFFHPPPSLPSFLLPFLFSSLPFPASQLAPGRTIKSFPSLSHPLSRMMTICLLKQHCDIMLPPHLFHHLSLLSSFSIIFFLYCHFVCCTHTLSFPETFLWCVFYLCFLALFFFLFVCKPVNTSQF